MILHVKVPPQEQYIRKHNSWYKKGLSALLEYHFGKVIAIQVVYERVIEFMKAKLLQVEEDENERVVLGQTEKR